MVGEFETFVGMARRFSNSMVVTIDARLVKFMGLEPGDEVRVMIKKVVRRKKNVLEK